MQSKLSLLVFSLTVLTLVSCKKDEKKTLEEFSLDALTNDSWRFVLNDTNTATNPKTGTNVYYAVQDCQKDDFYTFSKSTELFIDFRGTVCNPSASAKDNYVFDKPNKKITISGVTYTILELSEKRLKYSIALSTTSGYSNLIYLFEHN